VVLRFYADLTVEQIAEDLGVTTGTVKRHLHDANSSLAANSALAVPKDAS
jgi:RNA polymerase sigma-70 factor (ECF subfamily)